MWLDANRSENKNGKGNCHKKLKIILEIRKIQSQKNRQQTNTSNKHAFSTTKPQQVVRRQLNQKIRKKIYVLKKLNNFFEIRNIHSLKNRRETQPIA